MFCPKCGGSIPDGSKFCRICGANLSEAGAIATTDHGNSSEQPTKVAPETTHQPEFVKPKKPKNVKGIIGIAIAVVAVVAVVLGLSSLFSSSNGDNAYVYLSDGKYELITNLDKEQVVEIASSKSDSVSSRLVAFSPDEKYIYYYTKYDAYLGTGTLCRAEYGKLKADSAKNDKYIEIIATNALLGFECLDDGSIIYQNGDRTLYHYVEESATQIAKNIYFYDIDDSGRVIYTTGDDYDELTMYGAYLKDVDNKVKLASNVRYTNTVDFDNVVYTKREDDGSETLYVVGFEKDAEKIGENVSVLTSADGRIFFTSLNKATLNLYDFVEDSFESADSAITEPRQEDFSIPTYRYDMVYGNDLSESDFDELYTTCTKALYWYGESTWWSYSMEEALDKNWGDNTAGIYAATQSFIDKFGDTADENGYILVTDEVKAALKEIHKYAENPDEEWQWLWLCYNKYQSGSTIDYDAYYAAYDKWYEVEERVDMREMLQSEENEYNVYTLYCYEDGKLTAINENVLNTRLFNGAIMFNATDLVAETKDIESISSIYDVTELFALDYEEENYVVLTGGTAVNRMSISAADALSEAYSSGNMSLYFSDKVAFLSERDGALSVATINGGSVGDFKIIEDEAVVLGRDGSTLYYARDTYASGDMTYCDVYTYSDGSSTRLATDVLLDKILLYEDGAIMAYTGYRRSSGYELTMIDAKGETTLIGDGITQYIRVDKSLLLYISDGDLYAYNGKNKTMVSTDVDWVWSMKSMKIIRELN